MRHFFNNLLPNPSGQDQIGDHFIPRLAITLLLLTTPHIGHYLGLIPVLMSVCEEFIKDKHYLDFFKSTPSGADGRIDLFFKLLGSFCAYLTLLY